jgi:hypothetical protein
MLQVSTPNQPHTRDELNVLRETAHKEFHHLFFWQRPDIYFFSVELCVMLNCLFLSLYLTNLASLAADAELLMGWQAAAQLGMLLPALLCIYVLPSVTSTCSVLHATSDLDVEVVSEVLRDMVEAKALVQELREKILSMADASELRDQASFIQRLFAEIDADGSGLLDSDEFRQLLRSAQLTYSDRRYRLLLNAEDTSGNGLVSEDELQEFLFPKDKSCPNQDDLA